MDIKSVIQQFADYNVNADFRKMDDILAEDFQFEFVGVEKLNGKKAFIQHVKDRHTAGKQTVEIEGIVVDGLNAAANGVLALLLPDGTMKHYGFADFYTFNEEGRITKMKSYGGEIKKR